MAIAFARNADNVFIKGDKKNLSAQAWEESAPTTDLSAATATWTVYPSTSTTPTLASGAATISGTTIVTATRQWDTTAVAAGYYRAVLAFTFGANIQSFQYNIEVRTNP